MFLMASTDFESCIIGTRGTRGLLCCQDEMMLMVTSRRKTADTLLQSLECGGTLSGAGDGGDFRTARAPRAPAELVPGPLRTSDRAALVMPAPVPSPAWGRGRMVRPSKVTSRSDDRQTTQDVCSPGPGFLARQSTGQHPKPHPDPRLCEGHRPSPSPTNT